MLSLLLLIYPNNHQSLMLYKLRTLTSMHNDTSNYMMIPIVLGALNFIVQLNGVKPVLGISQFLLI